MFRHYSKEWIFFRIAEMIVNANRILQWVELKLKKALSFICRPTLFIIMNTSIQTRKNSTRRGEKMNPIA